MPRYQVINGETVQLTAQEEADRDAYEAAELAAKPMNDWKEQIASTDSTCPRWFEDYVQENSIVLAPGRVKDNYDAKVALRGQRP